MRKSVEWLSGTAQPLYNFLHWLDDQIYLLSERFWCQVNSLLQWNQICDGTDICWTVFSLSGTVYTDRTSQSIISGQYSVRASLCCTTSSTSPQPARRSSSQEYFLHLLEWRVTCEECGGSPVTAGLRRWVSILTQSLLLPVRRLLIYLS